MLGCYSMGMQNSSEEILKNLSLYRREDGTLETAATNGTWGLLIKRGQLMHEWDVSGRPLKSYIISPEQVAAGVGTVLDEEMRGKLSRLEGPLERSIMLAAMNAHWRYDPDSPGPANAPESPRMYCILPFEAAAKLKQILTSHERGVDKLNDKLLFERETMRPRPLSGRGDRAISLTLDEVRTAFGSQLFDRLRAELYPNSVKPGKEIRGFVNKGAVNTRDSRNQGRE